MLKEKPEVHFELKRFGWKLEVVNAFTGEELSPDLLILLDLEFKSRRPIPTHPAACNLPLNSIFEGFPVELAGLGKTNTVDLLLITFDKAPKHPKIVMHVNCIIVPREN